MPAFEPALAPAAPPLPLRLARRDSSQVRAANQVLQRAHDLPVQLAGQQGWLTLLPAEAAGRAGSPAGWQLSLFWGDVPFTLWLPDAAAQAWLGAQFDGLDLPALPEAFTGAVLETAVRGMLARLAERGREDLRLLRIEREGPATQGQEASWRLQLKSETALIEGRLSTTARGLLRLATGLQDWAPAAGPLASAALPLVLRAEVGFTWMTVAEWAGLRPGDAILVDRPLLAPDGELWLSCGLQGLRARPHGAQLVVTRAWQQEGASMDRYEDEDPGLDRLDQLRQLPMRVSFDIGELHLTLGELEALQVGQALDLGRPLSEAVQVRVHGARVGLGELVDIDGRLGVVLRSLAARDLSDLTEPADELGVAAMPPLHEPGRLPEGGHGDGLHADLHADLHGDPLAFPLAPPEPPPEEV